MMHVVTVNRNLIIVSPVPEGLTKCLTFKKTLRQPSYEYDHVLGRNKQVMQVVSQPCRLYGFTRERDLITFGGMFNRVRHFFDVAKLPYKITGEHPSLPEPDYSVVPTLRHKQDHAIAAIATYPRGLIVANTAFGKTFLCGLICAIWRTAKVLLVADSVSVCAGLSENVLKWSDESELRRHFGKYLQHKKEQKKDPRVIVTSIASMQRIPANWPDLILFDEAHTAPSATAMDGIMKHTRPKIFGLTASPKGRSDGSDDLTVALFGEVVCNVEYQEAVEHGSASQLTVYVVDATMEPVVVDNDFERDAIGIWRNDERSRRMIKAACDVIPPEDQILYYVKTLEHALRIRKLFLPGVPIAHGGCSRKGWQKHVKLGLVSDDDWSELGSPDVPYMEEAFRSGKIHRCICTAVWQKGTDFPDLLNMCRMDGEGSEITATQVPGRAGRVRSDGTQRKGVLIDANDNFGPGFSARWNKRLKTYKKKGWDIVELT